MGGHTNKLKRLIAVLAVLAVPLSPLQAADDLTSGNFPNQHALSWGDQSVLIYGDASSGNEYMRLRTNSVDRLYIDSSGQVGIGAAPTNPLSVTGAANVTGALTVSGAATLSGALTVSGAVQLGTQAGLTANTTGQIAVLVPIAAGALATVSTLAADGTVRNYGNCIASGTLAGAWVWPSTSSTASMRACN